MDTMRPVQEEQTPREVVLSYRPEPEPVVLRYEIPLPPGMCAQPEPEDPAEPAEEPAAPPRRSRRKLATFAALAGCVLLLTVCAVVYRSVSESLRSAPPDSGHYDTMWPQETDTETTIPGYPSGGSFQIALVEERGEALTAQEVYEAVNPSVVSVVTYLDGSVSVGTGVILSEDGYIVTNNHVIEGGRQCEIYLSTGFRMDAKLVGRDEETDLAVLKVEGEKLPAAAIGSSDLMVVGDQVYAIGNPLGLELRGTLTDGLVSAINRDVNVDGTTMTLIQTNAALNSGNSGGPLINAYGQVVGINTIKMVATYEDEAAVEGLGFAIPSSTVAHIVNSLIATGRVEPQPVLGITVQGLVTLPDGNTGVQIIEVTPDLGGDLAGIRAGDVIVSADGEPVASNSDVLRVRRRYQAGEYLPMVIYRDGEYLDVEVLLMAPVDAAA